MNFFDSFDDQNNSDINTGYIKKEELPFLENNFQPNEIESQSTKSQTSIKKKQLQAKKKISKKVNQKKKEKQEKQKTSGKKKKNYTKMKISLNKSLSDQIIFDKRTYKKKKTDNSKRIYTKRTTEEIKRWTTEECLNYEKFIEMYYEVMVDSNSKRNTRIFLLMSKYIGTKTPSQCRSHHQKFFKKVIKHLTMTPEEREEEDRRKIEKKNRKLKKGKKLLDSTSFSENSFPSSNFLERTQHFSQFSQFLEAELPNKIKISKDNEKNLSIKKEEITKEEKLKKLNKSENSLRKVTIEEGDIELKLLLDNNENNYKQFIRNRKNSLVSNMLGNDFNPF